MADLNEIYREYADTVFRFLTAKTGSRELAEELTQETFFRAVKSISSYDGSCGIGTWLCAVAKNVALSHLRSERRRARYVVPIDDALSDTEDTSSPVEDAVVEKEERRAVADAVASLPEPAREIVSLRVDGDLSFRQIGEVFGKTENWARVNFFRAKQLILKELEKNG